MTVPCCVVREQVCADALYDLRHICLSACSCARVCNTESMNVLLHPRQHALAQLAEGGAAQQIPFICLCMQ